MTGKQTFRALGLASLAALTAAAYGQPGWGDDCIDPENEDPRPDYAIVDDIGNDLIRVRMGALGQVIYGGDGGPCYDPARTLEAQGRFAIYNGPVGSVQTDFDDLMALTFGAPIDAAGDYCFARIIRFPVTGATDDRSVMFGNTPGPGLDGFFSGVSRRYIIAILRDGPVEATLRLSVIGDAVRYRWRLRNTSTEPHVFGVRFGVYPGMRTATPAVVDETGANQSGSWRPGRTSRPKFSRDDPPYIQWVTLPTGHPVRTGRNYLSISPNFPPFVNFNFGQTQPYGLRIHNVPTDYLPDQSRASQFIIDDHEVLLWENDIRGRIFDDFGVGDPILDAPLGRPFPVLERGDVFIDEMSFAQTFGPEIVPPGQSRDFVHYVRSTWSHADYADPYAAVVDAPRLVASVPLGTTPDPDQLGLTDEEKALSPNPFTIVAYVDNQYADLDQTVALADVRFTLNLPEDGGLRLRPGYSAVQTIATIPPNEVRSVSWQVIADGRTLGHLPYSVRIEPLPGPAKTITGTVLVAATPTLRLGEGPNFVTFPWRFADSSVANILGLTLGTDFQAYVWDPDLGQYVPATSAVRGRALWVVPTSDQFFLTLNGATPPVDTAQGGLIVNLRPGWNMVGNPYSYPVPLSQITAVAEDDPRTSMTWVELVRTGLVSSGVAFWERDPEDPTSGTYRFIESANELMMPNRGYWVYVAAQQPIRLAWPPIFLDGLPNSGRAPVEDAWRQTDRQWRLQLSARTESALDSDNFIGVAASAESAAQHRRFEPPAAPNQELQLSIEETVNGRVTRLAQSLADRMGRREWRLHVKAERPGEVVLTWPNIGTVPRNVNFQIVDEATNTARDLRFTSSFAFTVDQPTTRQFTLRMEPGGVSRAIIGNVLVSRPTRDRNAPMTITYTLSAQANTTIRILSGAGREIFTVTRGRADRVGQNSAVWTMRDNANRAVAPGSYRVEILAETSGGERVRKIVPINVVR
jgi:hypothetical protein